MRRGPALIAMGIATSVVVACGVADGSTTPAGPPLTIEVSTDPPITVLAKRKQPAETLAPVALVDGPAETVAPETTAAPALLRRFSVVAGGDILSHTSVIRQAGAHAGGVGFDWAPMFDAVRPVIESADVAICHLETPVRAPGTEVDGVVPVFGIPAEIAAGLKTVGYDRCSLSSNHALDQGAAGIDATLGAFDAAGLGHAGMARSAGEAAARLFEINGVTVGHVSASFAFNGLPLPDGEPWRANLIDPARIVADAQQARVAGASVVIVSLHWGSEGVSEVIPAQRQVADMITASGAVDLVIGHHAHVVQPIEQVNGRWVVFGMGNQLSGMGDSTDCCGVRALDGMMVRAEIVEQPDGTFAVDRPQAIPTYLGREPYRIVPVQAALADPAVAGHITPADLLASLDRTTQVVGPHLAF
ncbi:MAG: CapA family protein [Ilumatobacteraceae bacterium]